MTQEINGRLGAWATKCAQARPIEIPTKVACLGLFKQGYGYKKSARTLGLNFYTVRDWLRRYRDGDEAWATRDGRRHFRCIEAKDLIKYQYENEKICSSTGAFLERNRCNINSEPSACGGEAPFGGISELSSALSFGRVEEIHKRINVARSRKKKEVEAVQALVKEQGRTVIEACYAAGIPRATYYKNTSPTNKRQCDLELAEIMLEIQSDKHVSFTYGKKRLTAAVNQRLAKLPPDERARLTNGKGKVNQKRVHRLMKELDMCAHIRRKRHPDNYYKEVEETKKANIAPNILNRNFKSDEPLRKLSTDSTYIPCRDQKFVYLNPLIDLFNSEVVSYVVSDINSEEEIMQMIKALPTEAVKGALIHSDQGSLYWGNRWKDFCAALGIVRSMSRRGVCWDNAPSENFFSILKSDLGLTKKGYKTLLTAAEVKALIHDYIPWYNNTRIQTKLNYMSPVEYRKEYEKNPLPTDRVHQLDAIQIGEITPKIIAPTREPISPNSLQKGDIILTDGRVLKQGMTLADVQHAEYPIDIITPF